MRSVRFVLLLSSILCLLSPLLTASSSDLAGRVLNDHGEGVSQVRIQVVKTDGSARHIIVTNDGGMFETQLTPGDYLIYEAETSAYLGRVTINEEPLEIELHLNRPLPQPAVSLNADEATDSDTQQLQSIAGYRVFQTDDSFPALRSAAEIFNPFPVQETTSFSRHSVRIPSQ